MPSTVTAKDRCCKVVGTTVLCAMAACAQFPQSMAEQPWVDLWGDRGSGVLARDYHMCTEVVEQRRGLLAGCMEARGWKIN